MEKQMCECCKKEEVMEGYPVCLKCFTFTMQWGGNKEKQRMKYYLQKEQMSKDPAFKDRVLAARKAAMQKYYQNNKEKWNAYQREYKKRKSAENKALRERVAELEQQLNSMTRVDNAQLVR